MQEALRRIKEKPDYRELLISFVPTNVAAGTLYESLGFLDTGEIEDEELVFRMQRKVEGIVSLPMDVQ